MSKLVIVESPNKIKSIEKYLGNQYEVAASVGHIVYLPSSGEHRFGVDMEAWIPKYKIDPKKIAVVKELKKLAKKADEVLIATDPDREGEAIADNLVTFLDIDKKYHRIRFNEITKEAVTQAVDHPSTIDVQLVQSQIARRILDRMIGYKLSSLMRVKIKNSPLPPSAGRVQSIALKLVVEKEKLIEAFKPVLYKTVEAKINDDVIATLNNGNYHQHKDWVDPNIIEQLQADLTKVLTVKKVSVTKRKDKKIAPFKQAILYKRADSLLSLSAAQVQRAAQRLYEGYGDGGLITYPRTDSTRLSATFVQKAQAFITKKYGQEYIASDIKGTVGAQDAHEAIRPTDLALTPQKAVDTFKLSGPEVKVYELIYKNTMQALMKVPIREILRYQLTDGPWEFKLSSSKVVFDGYLKFTGYQDQQALPQYQEGERINVAQYLIKDNQTKPPARYNDGSLIETLDAIGVGRPSTFATTVNILKDREYVEVDNRALKPTDFGKTVLQKLLQAFPSIINEEYTANMETNLDLVAENKRDYKILLSDFWTTFSEEVDSATQNLDVTALQPVLAGKDCPVCGRPLIVRYNKRHKTKFFACSGFPECTHTESDPNSKRRVFKKWHKKQDK